MSSKLFKEVENVILDKNLKISLTTKKSKVNELY